MIILLAILSILAITFAVRLVNKVLPFAVCPICAGIFLTWTGLVVTHFAGYQIDLAVPALLMGGSVVGIAYQLEKKFRGLSADMVLLWKAFFMSAGFTAAYGLLDQSWIVFGIAMAVLIFASLPFLSVRRTGEREMTDEIERTMKDCC